MNPLPEARVTGEPPAGLSRDLFASAREGAVCLLSAAFAVLLTCGVAWAQGGAPAAAPKPAQPNVAAKTAPVEPKSKSETLRYNVNWPSGLSLGEGQLTSSADDGQFSLAFTVEAAVPGFALRESVSSKATAEFCSLELQKNGVRGKRTVDETTTFDQKNRTAKRETKKGGKSELSIPSCAKDALTYLFFLRRELAAGRLPQAQSVYYGAAYQVRAQYVGTQSLRIAGEASESDRIALTIKGPVAEITIDMFFARDALRTPLLVQVPLAMGKFAMELAR
jgi:hypothetical protein